MESLSERHKTLLIIFFFVVAVTLFSLNYYNNSNKQISETLEYEKAIAVRIIDGDTFVLSTGEVVRLICIDAPERGANGYKESTDFLSSLIWNKEILLAKDADDKDQYGRLLRYAFINDTFVNRELVQSGNAEVWRYGNNVKLCEEIER